MMDGEYSGNYLSTAEMLTRRSQTARPRLINSNSDKEIRPHIRRHSASNLSFEILDQTLKISDDDFKDSGIHLSGLELPRQSNEYVKHRKLPIQKHKFIGTDPRFRKIHRNSTPTTNAKSDGFLELHEDVSIKKIPTDSKISSSSLKYQNELDVLNSLECDEKAQQTELNVSSSHTQTDWFGSSTLYQTNSNDNLEKHDEEIQKPCLYKSTLNEWFDRSQLDQECDKNDNLPDSREKILHRSGSIFVREDGILPKLISERKLLLNIKLPEANSSSSNSLTDTRKKNDMLFSKVYKVTEDTSLNQAFRQIAESNPYGKALYNLANYILWFIALIFATFILLTFCLLLYPLFFNVYNRIRNRFRSPEENSAFRSANNLCSLLWNSVTNIFLQRVLKLFICSFHYANN